MIKTKIVATLGPASEGDETLSTLLDIGVDVLRLNFSHSSGKDRDRILQRVRGACEQTGKLAAVMGDLAGQKIRVANLNSPRDIAAGEELLIGVDDPEGNVLTTTYDGIVDDVEVGHRVLIDDGQVRLTVEKKVAARLTCRCEVGGVIGPRKGLNLPDTSIRAPSLTSKDFDDLDWAIKNDLTYVAVSFIRKPSDLAAVIDRIDSSVSDLLPIVKIEKPEALLHLDELIQMAAGVMVARGDLGVEMDVARVPLIQKDIARRCQQAGKPVIIATQMLQSMIENPYPTRAEVSDIANAIFDRADAIMLSGETAVGKYPIESVQMMNKVAQTTESFLAEEGAELAPRPEVESLRVVSAVAHSAAVLADELEATILTLWSQGGKTVRLLSKFRPETPVVGISDDPGVCRRMALHYGVLPVRMKRPTGLDNMIADVERMAVGRGWAKPGDLIVVVDSVPLGGFGGDSKVAAHVIEG
jgi:pyruvate kinase